MSLVTDPQTDPAQLAQALATGAHAGQHDKAKQPYITHPARVAARVASYGPQFVAVAWLHDVLEDTEVTAEDLLTVGFSQRVVDGVLSVTKREGEDHAAAVLRATSGPFGRVVKAADVADNADEERLALLEQTEASRLRAKYRAARQVLAKHGAPSFP